MLFFAPKTSRSCNFQNRPGIVALRSNRELPFPRVWGFERPPKMIYKLRAMGKSFSSPGLSGTKFDLPFLGFFWGRLESEQTDVGWGRSGGLQRGLWALPTMYCPGDVVLMSYNPYGCSTLWFYLWSWPRNRLPAYSKITVYIL